MKYLHKLLRLTQRATPILVLLLATEINFAQIPVSGVSEVTPEQVGWTSDILYAQDTSVTNWFYISTDFVSAFNNFDCITADDFEVPATGWSIDQVFVRGWYNSSGPAESIHIYFYPDSGGVPGSPIYSYLNQPFDFNGTHGFTINLTSPAQLSTPGTYWVGVQARMDYNLYGAWYWGQESTAYGNEAQWQNPDNGYGFNCITWRSIQSCLSAVFTDMTYILYGSTLPVELSSFTATTQAGKVILNWSTATETNNHGFEIERKIIKGEITGEWITIGFIEGYGTTTEPMEYSFIDDIHAIYAKSLSYRLKQIDFNGSDEYSPEVLVNNPAPLNYSLEQNYPNPFNPVTTISFGLPVKSYVEIVVYNSLGETVIQLVNEEKEAGMHHVELNATVLPSGVYFYQIRAGDFIQMKKMILLK
jgi:hypothetical protein